MEKGRIRQLVIIGIFLVAAFTLLARLFAMQVMDNSYETLAERNSIREIVKYPPRGEIYDRKGVLVAANQPVYDLVGIPRELKSLDTARLCKLLNIDLVEQRQYLKKLRKNRGYSSRTRQPIVKQIPKADFARFQEYLYQFPGLEREVRTVRTYNRNCAAHVLGYVGEVNQKQIDTSEYYRLGDHVGITGIERTYEDELRGERGIEYMIRDVHGRDLRAYMEGRKDKESIGGDQLTLTLDIELQEYAEQLLQNKVGGVVAIEPSTGEILVLASSPSYNPNMLTGRNRGDGIKVLQQDSLNPLFNRALMANYPPGSTFKPLMALVALNDSIINERHYYGCSGGYRLSSAHTVGCHAHAPCYDVQTAIKHSCNAYFCHLFKIYIESKRFNGLDEGLTSWQNRLNAFGLGQAPQVDIFGAKKGLIPGTGLYDRVYGDNKWRANYIISLGIGQGEMGTTPLQLAHMTACLANRGFYYHPHVIRPEVGDTSSIYLKKQNLPMLLEHFESVAEGMEQVVLGGTATVAFVPELGICGKTGTAQNPHGEDHSLFIAFAPKDDPQIAIAVMVENGGYGSRYAAPIASLVIERYLNGEISPSREYLQTRMFEADLIEKNRKRALTQGDPFPNP